MPNLNGTPRKTMKLKKPEEEEERTPRQKASSKNPRASDVSRKRKPNGSLFDTVDPLDDDDDESEEDEAIDTSNVKKSDSKIIFIIGAVIVVCVVIVAFLIFGGKDTQTPSDADTQTPASQSEVQSPKADDQNTQQGSQSKANEDTPVQNTDTDVGIQDFTQDTNMTTSSNIGLGDEFVKDLHGLSTRVDYTVDSIYEATDFVTYEKKRGTWDGGLELYYLDATYKGRQYVVQIPFKYYKELDDIGTVPVKMEVLRVAGSSEEDDRTIISYMCLDEEVLKTVMKSANKK